MATERRVSWIIHANIQNWQKNLDKAQRRMDRFGRKMQRAGRSLTQNLTMPLGAAAGASVKMASDFQSSLSQAQAQAALTAQQVTFIGDSAKRTAIRTGESTDDIIEAYKFTISAGLNLAKSQELVAAAAEASAAGFGKQRDLVRIATTAMQAYSDELQTGRQFMDLLIGSAQVMELEVSKLGPAFQRNVGVAKELGIGIDQLLAGIGAVSEIMGDAQRGGRMFQTMLSKILQPTAEAVANITDLYGSLEAFHRAIREDGLLQTMVQLRQRLEEAGMGMEDVFTGQEGLEAALNFTNRNGERTNEILRNMGDTLGSTKSAFDAVSDSTERNFKQALQGLKVTAIELGEIMIPMANKIIDSIRQILQRFRDLSTGAKVNVLKIAGLLAAGGPLLLAFGTFVRAVSSMVGIIRSKFLIITGVFATTVATGQWMVDNSGSLAKTWENAMLSMQIAAKKMALGVISAFQNVTNLFDIKTLDERLGTNIGLPKTEKQLGKLEKTVNNLQKSISSDTEKLIDNIGGVNFGSFAQSGVNAFNKIKGSIKSLLSTMTQGTALGDFIDFVTGVGGGGGFGFSDIDTGEQKKQWGVNVDQARFPNPLENLDTGQLEKASSKFDTVAEAMGNVSEQAKVMGQALQQSATGAITSFAETLGNAFTGDAGASGFFNNLLMIVVDFANQFGKLLIAAGVAAQAFKSLLANPFAAIAAGAALVAATTAVKNLLREGPEQESSGRETSVNDAIIRSDGSIVNLHPNDDLLAAQNLGGMIAGASGGQVIKNELFLDGNTVWSNQRRVNTNKRR